MSGVGHCCRSSWLAGGVAGARAIPLLLLLLQLLLLLLQPLLLLLIMLILLLAYLLLLLLLLQELLIPPLPTTPLPVVVVVVVMVVVLEIANPLETHQSWHYWAFYTFRTRLGPRPNQRRMSLNSSPDEASVTISEHAVAFIQHLPSLA